MPRTTSWRLEPDGCAEAAVATSRTVVTRLAAATSIFFMVSTPLGGLGGECCRHWTQASSAARCAALDPPIEFAGPQESLDRVNPVHTGRLAATSPRWS